MCSVLTRLFATGTRYARRELATQRVGSLREEEPIMLMTELPRSNSSDEPAACFPTDAEIEIAEQLRHQLEERYLGPSAADAPLREQARESH